MADKLMNIIIILLKIFPYELKLVVEHSTNQNSKVPKVVNSGKNVFIKIWGLV